jgi:hypothetical protein
LTEAVDHPKHYQGKVECIDAIAIILSQNELGQNPLPPIGSAILFNVVKYCWRKDLKNGAEDIAKAQWYRNWLIGYLHQRCSVDEVSALMNEFDALVDHALSMRD